MRILVFGGTGLIGTPVCARLREAGCEVILFTRRRAVSGVSVGTILQGDITNAEDVSRAFEECRPETVLQLAACLQFDTENNPALGVATNVVGATNVLSAASSYGARRIIFGSSIAAYGERADMMYENDAPAASMSLYGLQKRLGEQLGIRFATLNYFEFAALRYSGVFGPGNVSARGMSLARHLLMKTVSGCDVQLDFVSGDEKTHLTFVDDAVDATLKALLCPKLEHSLYNVGGPEENYMTLREFHRLVHKVVPGAGQAIFRGSARSAGPLDLSRIANDIGYTPKYGVEAALRKCLISLDHQSADCHVSG